MMMNLGKFLIELATESVNVFVQPKKYWEGMKNEENPTKGVFIRFFLPGLFFIFLAIVLGDVIFESEYGVLLKDTLIKASREILFLLLVYFASTMIMYEVSRRNNIPLEFETARKITVYSMIPIVVISIVTGVFPFFYILDFGAFYSLYLVYTALIIVFELKPNRKIVYFVVLLSAIFISYLLIALLLSKLTALIIY